MATNIAELRKEQSSQGQKLGQTHQDLKKLLEDLHLPINRLDTRLSYIQDDLERQSRLKLLNSISTIKYFTHHSRRTRSDAKFGHVAAPKRDSGIGGKKSSSSVLWLHGMVGSGKTKIASRD